MVPQFLNQLKHVNMLLLQFLSTTAAYSFSPTELKRIFIILCPLDEGKTLSIRVRACKLHQQKHYVPIWYSKRVKLTRTDAKQETATRSHKANCHLNQVEVRNTPTSILITITNRSVKNTRRKNLLMTTTALFMVQATNGGSVTRINMVRTFVLIDLQDPQPPMLLSELPANPLFTMDYLLRYKFIEQKQILFI